VKCCTFDERVNGPVFETACETRTNRPAGAELFNNTFRLEDCFVQ
jgi:hypothetical protein